MRLLLLHLDDALEPQADFVQSCLAAGAEGIDARAVGRDLRLWGRDQTLDHLRNQIFAQHDESGPVLTFMGSGDFHHVSALLVDYALRKETGPVTLIHLDNHPDWVRFNGGMHCGSWVNRALAHERIAKVITLGVCSDDLVSPGRKGAELGPLLSGRVELYPYAHPPSRVRGADTSGASFDLRSGMLRWKTIAAMGPQAFADHLMTRIETDAVYLTLDKDVLSSRDAVTNWDQGHMSLHYALHLIRRIGQRHRLVGADVTGDYSAPLYGGSVVSRLMKRAEIVIDQPWGRPSPETFNNLNSAANLALLEVFGEIMP